MGGTSKNLKRMARQKGIIKITGTVGGLNFYIAKGEAFVRQAGGGFNGDAIRTKESMRRVRENATEFGAASMALKQFRRSLLPVFSPPKYRPLQTRLMGLFMELKVLDGISTPGNRRVAQGLTTLKGKQLLKDFVFLPDCMALNYIASRAQFDWETQTLHFAAMDLRNETFITGSSHLALSFMVIDFDFETLTYTSQVSETVMLGKDEVAAFSLDVAEVVPPQHTGIVALGLRFCEVLGEEVYPARGISGLGCRVVEVIS